MAGSCAIHIVVQSLHLILPLHFCITHWSCSSFIKHLPLVVFQHQTCAISICTASNQTNILIYLNATTVWIDNWSTFVLRNCWAKWTFHSIIMWLGNIDFRKIYKLLKIQSKTFIGWNGKKGDELRFFVIFKNAFNNLFFYKWHF